MSYFDDYLTIIFIVKIIFIILAMYGLYIKLHKHSDIKLLNTIKYWKGRTEFIFITLMSVLFMYLFIPIDHHIVMIDSELKLLLFLFGFTLLLTENWYNFIHNSIFFK
jgi:hypothetical protein